MAASILRSLLASNALAMTLVAGGLWAQPASITTTATTVPVAGPAVFDPAGNLYFFLAGPVTPGAAQTQNGGGTCLSSNGFFSFPGPCPDGYAGKLDASGNLVFGTYLGGPTADQSTALAVDGAGNVFVTGSTEGSFPTTAKAAIAASTTAKSFAAKISADGSRVLYSTYLPDTAGMPSAIAIDAQGNAYIAGKSSTGHAFVVKLSADGSAFLYHVSLAGSAQDSVNAVSADSAGNVIVAGQTTSPDFPVTPGTVQSRLMGAQNGFIARLDPSGGVVFSTYLGGSGTDTPTAVQTDSASNIYVAGQTSSLDFPTTSGSFEPDPIVPMWNNSAPAGFAAKLSADGSALSWSSYVMSADHPLYQGVTRPSLGVAQLAVSASGEAYIAGLTGPGFPVTASAPQVCFDGLHSAQFYNGIGATDAFVAHLDPHGALLDATYVSQGVTFTVGLSLAGDGSVLLAMDSAGNRVKSRLRFGGTGWKAPACLSPAVLNAATLSTIPYSATGPALVPGEFITLTGFGIGPDIGVADQGQVTRELAGVQVLFDGQPAPVLYAQSRQINALAPVELSGQTKTNITVLYNRAAVGSIEASVVSYGSPGIFRLHPGVSSQAAAVNEDGTINGPANPAARGSVVSVWGTGFGLIDPPCATGGLNPPGPVSLAAGISVDIADGSPPGVPVQYAPALYAGSAPTLPCGVVQINVQVPTYVAPGLYQFFPWSLMALPGGAQSVAIGTIGATISVK
ncbi:MAG TPA: SBBP repeat-containing protein [Bryobacteraceae bacterium]|nr:SBBP repeat-containing protein [Bryobacteraceae bacterium]